jgi:regulator of replication initiation timing
MSKQKVYEQELAKLNEIFTDVDESKKKLVEGLIQDAAFLYAENYELRRIIDKTGMIKVHPQNMDLQKPTEAGKQYLKNINSYSVIIKTLNGVLQKGDIDEEDDLEEFE